jgi:SAM-dependent methyltransferase
MTPVESKRTDPTRRFSNRVENYVRFRPHYPPEILGLLTEATGLTTESVVADIGSGTGILTELLLGHGCQVVGVEPNLEMRLAAESLLAGYPRFRSMDAAAERTTLPDRSIDLIVVAQAFHWFDAPRARVEFRRILRPGGFAALIWNERRQDSTPFQRAYEQLLTDFGTDYREVGAQHIKPEKIDTLFGSGGFRKCKFDNYQSFDYPGLEGRLLSSSYIPTSADPRYLAMLARLRQVFDQHQADGRVGFEYDTLVYYGRLE